MVSKQTIEAMTKAGLSKEEAEKLADRFTLAEARRATVKRLMSAGFTGNEAEAIYAKLRRRPKKGTLSMFRPGNGIGWILSSGAWSTLGCVVRSTSRV